MASPKSDDDVSGGKPKPSQTDLPARPGVYVQVSGTPRNKKSSSSYKALESGNHAVEETRPARAGAHQVSRANPGPLGMGSASEPRSVVEPRSEPAPRTQSQVREKAPVHVEPVVTQPRARAPRIVEVNESNYEPDAESENTNYRADMVRFSARPSSLPPERLSAASVLDAKPAVRSEPPAPARTPWGMIALVSVMSAIITAAGVVALQEWMQAREDAAQGTSAPQAEIAQPPAAPTQPAAVPAPAMPAPPDPAAAEPAAVAPSAEIAASPSAAQPAPELRAAAEPQAEPVAPPAVAPDSDTPAALVPEAAPAPVAAAPAPDAAPGAKRSSRRHASASEPVVTEPAKPSLAFRKPPESWGTDEPAAPAPIDTAAIPSNPYAGDGPVAP